MASPPTPGPVRFDAAGRIDDDLICVRCEYNLRGSDPNGRCPECGLAVGRSAVGHWLRFCDPDWLQGIWRGLNRLGVGIAACFLLLGLAWGLGTIMEFGPVFLAAILATVAVMGLYGFWKATAPDPDKVEHEPLFTPRRGARWMLVGTIAASLAFVAIGPHIQSAVGLTNFTATLIGVACTSGWFLGVMLLLWHARRLALRIPNKPLAASTVVLLMCVAVSAPLWSSHTFGWLPWLSWIYEFYGWGFWNMFYWIEGLLALAIVGCHFAMAGLFLWYWVALKREATFARSNWARAEEA